VRTSTFARNASGLALVMLLAGCSGGNSQTPALSGPANPLALSGSANALALSGSANALALSGSANALGQGSAAGHNRGFMESPDAKTKVLYISSFGTEAVVDVLSMSGVLVGQITEGLVEPEGLFVDGTGNLWVANFSNVLVYPHGSLTPTATLEDPVGYPTDVTVCPNGTAYVADLYDVSSGGSSASIQVYPPGNTTPSGSLTFPNDIRNPVLTCDAAGNVFVGISTSQYVGNSRVIEFPLGQQAGAKDLGIALQYPGGIKPDNAGNLLVNDVGAQTMTEYSEAGAPTGISFATGDAILGIALSRDGNKILGANPAGPSGTTWSFPAGKQERSYTCCSRIGPPLQDVFGVAFYPGQKGI
jgi:hypothetical protein